MQVRARQHLLLAAVAVSATISPALARGPSSDEAAFPVLTGPYLGQEPPGPTPTVFAANVMTAEHGYHSTVVFAPDLREAFWSPMLRGHRGMWHSKVVDGRWTYPQEVDFGMEMGATDPTYSPDGNTLYFLSFQPPRPGDSERERIWYVERRGTGWSAPKVIAGVVRAHPTHWTFSIARSGNLYFTSEIRGVRGEQDIYVARFENGAYTSPEDLGSAINTDGMEMTPCIARDERYLIFARIGKDTRETDLYISYKDPDGRWTKAIDMGERVNAEYNDLCPYVSPDEKYLFFLGQRDEGAGKTIRMYWMDSGIIEELRREALGVRP